MQQSGKLQRAETVRQPSVQHSNMPHIFSNCGEVPKKPKLCSKCKAVKHCGKNCQQRHWPKHQKLVSRNRKIVARSTEKVEKQGQYGYWYKPEQHAKLVG